MFDRCGITLGSVRREMLCDGLTIAHDRNLESGRQDAEVLVNGFEKKWVELAKGDNANEAEKDGAIWPPPRAGDRRFRPEQCEDRHE